MISAAGQTEVSTLAAAFRRMVNVRMGFAPLDEDESDIDGDWEETKAT